LENFDFYYKKKFLENFRIAKSTRKPKDPTVFYGQQFSTFKLYQSKLEN